MFKSVFTKYVTAFMIMIGISFSLLAIILSQMVSGYAQDSKSRVIERTSETLTDFITSQYREAGRRLQPVHLFRPRLGRAVHIRSREFQ